MTKIWYGVVAPGYTYVTDKWSVVERIKSLYTYPKWHKCYSEQEANEWVSKNKYRSKIEVIQNYGDTFKGHSLFAEYRIMNGYVVIKFDTKNVGTLRLFKTNPNYFIEYIGSVIKIRINNYNISNETITGHISVIYTILELVGEYIDVNVKLPYYGIFYALSLYSQNRNDAVTDIRKVIRFRLGKVGFSYGDYDYVK